jgi:hypothetical protein
MKLALAGDTMLGRVVAKELGRRPPQSLVDAELVETTRAADPFLIVTDLTPRRSHALVRSASETLKVGELIKLLAHDGWYLAATRGSHRQFKHPVEGRTGDRCWQAFG